MSTPTAIAAPQAPETEAAWQDGEEALAPWQVATVRAFEVGVELLAPFIDQKHFDRALPWIEKGMHAMEGNWRLAPAFGATLVLVGLMVPQFVSFHDRVIDPASSVVTPAMTTAR